MHIDYQQFMLTICNQCSRCKEMLSMLLYHLHQQHHFPGIICPVQERGPKLPPSLQQADFSKISNRTGEKQKKMKKNKQLSCDTITSCEKVVQDEDSDGEVQCTCVQQCPDGLDKQDELVILTSHSKTSKIHDHLRTHCSMERTASKSLHDEQNKLSLKESSTAKRDQPSFSSNINDKESGKDDLNDHTQQCKQVGQDELVIVASRYNWHSHDYIHTIVCRYCREEVNSCYYEDHLVSCLESYKCGQGDCLVNNRDSQKTRGCILPELVTTKHGHCEFVVNCTATEESYNQ